MHSTLTVKHMEKTPQIEQYFSHLTEKLTSRLKTFNQDLIDIHGMIERNLHRQEFLVIITVKLHSGRLRAQESNKDILSAFNSCLESLNRQVEKIKNKLARKNRKRI